MAKKIFSAIAKYALPVILGVSAVVGVEKAGIPQIYSDIQREKAQVDYRYNNYVGAWSHEIGRYTARGLADTIAFGAPFMLALWGTDKLEEKIRKKDKKSNKEAR